MRWMVVILVLGGAAALSGENTDAAQQAPRNQGGPPRVDFARQVFPILQRSCLECHGPRKQEGDLRLDRRDDLLASGVVSEGAPDDSELIRRVALPRGHEEIMPAVGEPLTKDQIVTLRRWVEQGAVWPKDFQTGEHWSYLTPQRPAAPLDDELLSPADARNMIDRFVQRRLREHGLRPAPPADPATLVRRLYLDLIGLPPTPSQVDAFLGDPSDAAYARLVESLLQSPQFGERWARPWLDLARYADSHGFQRDDLRDIWAYRDWVIQALNDDMPYDRFTIEQLAGDLLPNATESQRIATGFHRCAPTNVEAGSLPEETRIEQVIDRVNTTAAVWLGSTLACAQCHDHKYDPFTMKDYYSLLAFFNSTELEADRTDPKTPSSIQFRGPLMPLSDAKRDQQRGELEQQLADSKSQQQKRRLELKKDLDAWAIAQRDAAEATPRSQILAVTDFESQGATDSHRVLEDGAVLLVGDDPPETDRYVVRATLEGLDAVSTIRLEALKHPSLPGEGPGRGDPQRTNFVLQEFTAEVQLPNGEFQEVKFSAAKADFSQKNWDVAGAVDGQAKTGWAIAPQFDKSHWADFRLKTPLDASQLIRWTFTLSQNWGGARTLGCFRLTAHSGDPEAAGLPDKITKILKRPTDQWTNPQRKQLLDWRAEQDEPHQDLGRHIADLEKQVKSLAPDTTLVMIATPQPRATHVFLRGDYRNPGPEVQPATIAALHPMPPGPGNRLTLAKWLVSRDNPLAARVAVNRWWAELFGRGIVATVEDFGVKGQPPTHPDLLDWLAVEFMDSGWSMKHVLRTIVLSSTYRQSSRVTAELLQQDDENQWLARGPCFRMDAETIRDNALAVSGLLSLKQFGEPIRPYQPPGVWRKVGGVAYDYQVSSGEDQYRRGVYVVLKRAPYPSFVNFDASARLACTVKRSRTNTPLQALTLLNDPVYVDAAKALAARPVLQECPQSSAEDRLQYMFRLCTARFPTAAERDVLLRLLTDESSPTTDEGRNAIADAADVPALAKDVALPNAADSREFAGWYRAATTLLNLHETITRN